jgi:hypothetical protein
MSGEVMDAFLMRLKLLEHHVTTTAATLERMEKRLDRIDTRMDTIEANQRSDFRWLVGIMLGGFAMTIGGFAGTLAVIAHGFHWL